MDADTSRVEWEWEMKRVFIKFEIPLFNSEKEEEFESEKEFVEWLVVTVNKYRCIKIVNLQRIKEYSGI